MNINPQTIDTDRKREQWQYKTPAGWKDCTREQALALQQAHGSLIRWFPSADNLRELHKAAPENPSSKDDDGWDAHWQFYDAARNALPAILDELDRLRAAEAASKVRVEELANALTRQTENMAFIINNCDIARWYDKLLSDLEADRVVLSAALAEIARLTDAGAAAGQPHLTCSNEACTFSEGGAFWCQECLARHNVAPPPPAAADRGVPEQSAEAESDNVFLSRIDRVIVSELVCRGGTDTRLVPTYWLKRLRALATAPKAEDVRREAIEEAADAISGAAWLHLGDDAYSQGMDKGAQDQVDACYKAVRALLGDAR